MTQNIGTPPTYIPDISIPIDDGVELVGDLVYPADPDFVTPGTETFPVLLTQNPYECDIPRTNLESTSAVVLAQAGYIVASVCVRGTGRSGGEFSLFGEREQLDGVQLVD